MSETIARREFLKLGGLTLATMAFRRPPPPDRGREPVGLARVTIKRIGLYSEPSFHAPKIGTLTRDEIVTILARERSDEGPRHNPLWYRLDDGYAHSGNLQPVRWQPQAPVSDIPATGALFEVSVPYTRSYTRPDPTSRPLYRLYYQSTAWAEALTPGADGLPWYRLRDDLLKVTYYVRAEHLRRVHPEELAPISPDIPLRAKRIEVSIARQELLAFEYDRLVFRTRISSGIPSDKPTENGIPTATPKGDFYVDKKMPLRHMGDGRLTSDLDAYELPGVPWVSYFYLTGVAFHGTYWHADFGRPRSHGCINMRPEDAKWLFRWTLPVIEPHEILRVGHGTTVTVI